MSGDATEEQNRQPDYIGTVFTSDLDDNGIREQARRQAVYDMAYKSAMIYSDSVTKIDAAPGDLVIVSLLHADEHRLRVLGLKLQIARPDVKFIIVSEPTEMLHIAQSVKTGDQNA